MPASGLFTGLLTGHLTGFLPGLSHRIPWERLCGGGSRCTVALEPLPVIGHQTDGTGFEPVNLLSVVSAVIN